MTLALLITAATGAWADNLNKVKYALTAGLTISAGTTADVKDDDGNVVATITYSEDGGNDFTTKATSSTSALDGYTAFTEGNGTNGEQTGGTFYTIVPVCDGTIDVAVVLNADKPFYILEDGTALEGYNGKTVDSKYYGTFTFNVKADKTYKIFAYNSKVGFYGFEFTYEPITWVYPTANTNEWTFQMPDNDVIAVVNYYPGRLTFGAATEGGTVEIVGMSDNKMPKGFEKSEKGNIYVEEGTTFIVKAVPAEGFHFVSWSDDAENTSRERTITMGEENLELSATFSNTFDVTLNTENLSNEEAALWKGAAGDNAPTPFKLTGVKVGTPVKAIYSGQRRVKSVKAVMKSPAATSDIYKVDGVFASGPGSMEFTVDEALSLPCTKTLQEWITAETYQELIGNGITIGDPEVSGDNVVKGSGSSYNTEITLKGTGTAVITFKCFYQGMTLGDVTVTLTVTKN